MDEQLTFTPADTHTHKHTHGRALALVEEYMGHLAGQSPPTGPVRLYGCIDYELVCLQARSQACAFQRLRMRDVVRT